MCLDASPTAEADEQKERKDDEKEYAGGSDAVKKTSDEKGPDHLMWIGAGTGWKVVAVVHYFVVLRKFTASTAGAKIKGGRLELVQRIAASSKQGVSSAPGTQREMAQLLDNGNLRTCLCIAMAFEFEQKQGKSGWSLGQISRVMMKGSMKWSS